MKRFYISIIILISIFSNVYSKSSIAEFKAMTPERQVDTIISEYQYHAYEHFPLDFLYKAEIISENKDVSLCYMLQLLNSFELTSYFSETNPAIVLHSVIDYAFYQDNKLNTEDLQRTAHVYEIVIKKYLQKYKTIDVMVLFFESSIVEFLHNDTDEIYSGFAKDVYDKYTGLGFTNLTISTDEIEKLWDVY